MSRHLYRPSTPWHLVKLRCACASSIGSWEKERADTKFPALSHRIAASGLKIRIFFVQFTHAALHVNCVRQFCESFECCGRFQSRERFTV